MLISFAIRKSYGKNILKEIIAASYRDRRQYNVDVLNNAIREWARNNGVFIEDEKDVSKRKVI